LAGASIFTFAQQPDLTGGGTTEAAAGTTAVAIKAEIARLSTNRNVVRKRLPANRLVK
jgi:hypothetical protein